MAKSSKQPAPSAKGKTANSSSGPRSPGGPGPHGERAEGGPAGANQGGAPRGSSRLEPSHQQQAAKKDQPRPKKPR
jgi:hypothetical protein